MNLVKSVIKIWTTVHQTFSLTKMVHNNESRLKSNAWGQLENIIPHVMEDNSISSYVTEDDFIYIYLVWNLHSESHGKFNLVLLNTIIWHIQICYPASSDACFQLSVTAVGFEAVLKTVQILISWLRQSWSGSIYVLKTIYQDFS